nr:PTS transporter subunit EIIC [uncultured Lactobacillus sp.]
MVTNTLKVMFPIIVIGSFAQVIKFSFLRPDGFISSTLGSNHWLPSIVITQLTWMMGMIYHASIDMIALLAAIAMSHYTVKEYDREFKGGAIAGGFAFFVLSCRPLDNGGFTYDHYLMANGMFIAIIIGYLSGRILLKFNNSYKNGKKRSIILALTLIAIGCAILNLGFGLLENLQLPTYISSYVTSHSSSQSLGYVLGMGFLTNALAWIAMGGPFIEHPTFTDTASWANLQHALQTHSAYNATYPFTSTTLFHSYANFRGSGVTLALIIAIFIFSKRKDYRTVCKWSIFPAIFNNHYPMMLGIPILYNPIYFIPFVLAPLVNIGIAAIFMIMNLVPAAVYPVPLGTPGPLIAFIGTGGNWGALLLGTGLIILDVFIYLPFVKIADNLKSKAGEM